MELNGVKVEDTFCEAFDGLFTRFVVTGVDDKRLNRAATESTALPLTVFDESEAGAEKELDKKETPDKRKGFVIQVWSNYESGVDKLEHELSKRVRQGILVVPGTRIFNYLESEEKIDVMEKIGHCGDGYEWKENRFGREVINIPIMMGEFLIERELGFSKGVMGGNIWFFAESMDSALKAGDKAIEAIKEVNGVVTPFDICSAGSKVETNYPEIGPTTNHPYCPTLREKIENSKVPEDIEAVPEIIINGMNKEKVKKGMKKGIKAASKIEGIKKISAGNFNGELGKHKIHLKDIV
ncbi:MAG: Formylmethanofuran:tetrahydromethanopterin formyltransferase Ftr [Candidatus Methanohalarchaeum thermophilum]|uniref:Formylmethanofuran:tetrahydromethanopterin formyltransferase Ftr n=1 Tax=Methanohalarchaeum thermophilum TaxID=1903181 RepID=A0A1Q6DXV1_METT1|nr:MAG: Formylmethanofuran:tetrahydromethanopterin formyltransferase Ftr [Candidatus Methanohalarchaeum thermophilum]